MRRRRSLDRIEGRELRQRARRLLARVASGDTIEVSDRGRPIALLVATYRDRRQDLVATGPIIEATGQGDLLDEAPVDFGIDAPGEDAAPRDDARLAGGDLAAMVTDGRRGAEAAAHLGLVVETPDWRCGRHTGFVDSPGRQCQALPRNLTRTRAVVSGDGD